MRVILILLLVLVSMPAKATTVPFGLGDNYSTSLMFENDFEVPTDALDTSGTFPTFTTSFVFPEQDRVSSSVLQLEFWLVLRTMTTYTGTGRDITGTSATNVTVDNSNFSVFRNGSPIDVGSVFSSESVSVIFCGTGCTLADSGLIFLSLAGIFFPGDELLIEIDPRYRTRASPSEVGVELDTHKIEYSIDLSGRGEYTVSQVPLPPAIWLFLGALSLLVTRLRRSRASDDYR